MQRTFGILLAVLIFAGLSSAQTWKVDPTHSRVTFGVTYMMLSEVTGRFTEFDATLTQGKEDFSGSTVYATIATKSINTDNETRDKHLRSDDFFNAEKFPSITFVTTSFVRNGEGSYTVTGNLTMRDVTKEISLATALLGTMTDPRGNTRAGFKATGKLNRQEFGVRFNKALEAGGVLVGNDVEITLNLQFIRQK